MDSAFNRINKFLDELPRNKGSFDGILIIRLLVAAVLLAVALIVEMQPVFKVILLILSAIVAGYDIILDLVDAVMDGDYFAAPVFLVVIALLSFMIGYGWEGSLLLILYQLGIVLVELMNKRMKRAAQEILNRKDAELAERASVLMEDEHAGETRMEKEIGKAVRLVLTVLSVFAILFAIGMPIFTDLSVKESVHRALIVLTITMPLSVVASIPLAGIIGMGYATHFGVLFNNARVIEKLRQVKTAVIDKNGVFADDKPEFLGVKSDVLDEKTFMEFVAHAVYYSDQPFAKAILNAVDYDFRLDLISDFHDIPGAGLDVKIGGTDVTLARRELLADRGEAVPYEGKDDSSVYYLMVSGKYIGKVLLSENMNARSEGLLTGLKTVGIKKCILLTEDGKEDSERLGVKLNADEVFSEFSEETKLRYLESLDGKDTLYVYANSLQAHSNASLDIRVNRKGKYSDALIMPESLSDLPFAVMISQRVYQIAEENAIFAVGVKALLLFLGLTGNCTVWFAIFLDFIAALATMLNAIRVTKEPLMK